MGAVKINGTTSGSVSLEAPDSGSDVTLTFPGTTMNLGTELASKLPIAGGKILQIVRATDSTSRSTTSSSYVDVTGMSVTITPQKSDSAILIIAAFMANVTNATDNEVRGRYAITDSSNNILIETIFGPLNFTGSGTRQAPSPLVLFGYATPATTSAVTFKMRFRKEDLNASVFVRNDVTIGQMYAIEVSA